MAPALSSSALTSIGATEFLWSLEPVPCWTYMDLPFSNVSSWFLISLHHYLANRRGLKGSHGTTESNCGTRCLRSDSKPQGITWTGVRSSMYMNPDVDDLFWSELMSNMNGICPNMMIWNTGIIWFTPQSNPLLRLLSSLFSLLYAAFSLTYGFFPHDHG